MKIDVLYSSSDGNACRVSNGRTSLLIDCGVTRAKLFKNGRFPIDALFLSHGHHDHHSGVPILAKYEKMPIYLEEEVYLHLTERKPTYFGKSEVKFINGGDSIKFGDLTVHLFQASHDGAGGLNFIIEENNTDKRFAHITDTGIVNIDLAHQLASCHGILLEANHDLELLAAYDDYPEFLKQRIRGDEGHLSNSQAFDLIKNHLDLQTNQWICFGHLSKKTNTPKRVIEEAKQRFPEFTGFHLAPKCLIL